MAYWALIPAAYQILAIIATIVFLRQRAPRLTGAPSVSILKPTVPGQWPPAAAIESHRNQEYPEFELLYSDVEGQHTPNRKVGKLMTLAARARHPIWIINDADICVPADYLKRVVATLEQPGVGIVTSPYRASGDSPASRFEALGVAVDFMPSVFVARLVGMREFGLGATLAFRKADLDRIGGLAAMANYLADDYQMGKKITQLGLRAELAPVVVETTLHGDWQAVWRHQVRWARTIRLSKGNSYKGLPITHAGLWIVVALLWGAIPAALGLCIVRVAAAAIADRALNARVPFLLAPVWDLFAFAVWLAGLFGRTVEWGGRTLYLDRDGRIVFN